MAILAVESAPFSVFPFVLFFARGPEPVQAGTALPPVTVRATENGVPFGGEVVHLEVSSGPGEIFGTLSAETDAQGIATFADLVLDFPGTYTLLATHPDADPVESAPFEALGEPTAASHKLAHVQEALGFLLQQYKGRPRLEGVLSAFVAQVQDLEDAFFALLTERWLSSAQGVNLDLIGRLVNLKRGADPDSAFRVRLQVEILSLRASGTPEEIRTLAALLFGAERFDLDDSIPRIRAHRDPIEASIDAYLRIFRRAAPAGIRIVLEYLESDPAETFALSETADTGSDPDTGLGSVADPTSGGMLAGVAA